MQAEIEQATPSRPGCDPGSQTHVGHSGSTQLSAGDERFIGQLESYALKLRHIQPGIDGKDLTRMGLKPSPRIRTILEGLRAPGWMGRSRTVPRKQALLQKLLQ